MVDDLVAELKSVEKIAIVKALTTWLDLGVLKEDDHERYKLLEVAEAALQTVIAAEQAAS